MALEFLSPLHKASRQLALYIEQRTGEVGLSATEGHILTYLRSYEPAPVGELVRVFGIKQSTFTSILDRLERAGLLLREVNPDDRRSFLIRLTPAGVDLTARMRAVLLALEDDIRSRLSAEEVAGFRAFTRVVEEITAVQVRSR